MPVRHFGAIHSTPEWKTPVPKRKATGLKFIIELQPRFEGQVGEHHTKYVLDPSGNAVEFMAFADPPMTFTR